LRCRQRAARLGHESRLRIAREGWLLGRGNGRNGRCNAPVSSPLLLPVHAYCTPYCIVILSLPFLFLFPFSSFTLHLCFSIFCSQSMHYTQRVSSQAHVRRDASGRGASPGPLKRGKQTERAGAVFFGPGAIRACTLCGSQLHCASTGVGRRGKSSNKPPGRPPLLIMARARRVITSYSVHTPQPLVTHHHFPFICHATHPSHCLSSFAFKSSSIGHIGQLTGQCRCT
jgi:hypothetical protein